ncbi:MAG: phytanoyl-CoA dioxygenase family protein, partial [Myxococcota bacterium]
MAAAETYSRSAALCEAERIAWQQRGFFFREAVFDAAEIDALRDAAESVVAAAEAALPESHDRYEIDGNVYVEVELASRAATVQLEHTPGSRTVRVIEPFHGLDPRFDLLVDDERLVAPMRGIIGSERVALFTDKMNLKRPREGSRFDWHQDSPYWAHFCDHLDRLPNVMLTLDDADRDSSDARDTVTVEVSTPRGEKETVELKESLAHSGVFVGMFKLKPNEKPAAGNLDKDNP